MNKNLLSAVVMLSVMLLTGCSDDEPILPPEQPEPLPLFDPLFAKELERRGYIESADSISPEDVADITDLDVSGGYYEHGEIKSLRGIEYFVNIQRQSMLICKQNPVFYAAC